MSDTTTPPPIVWMSRDELRRHLRAQASAAVAAAELADLAATPKEST